MLNSHRVRKIFCCNCAMNSPLRTNRIHSSNSRETINSEKGDEKTVHSLMENVAIISGNLPHRSETIDYGTTGKFSAFNSPTITGKNNTKKLKGPNGRIRRSKSTGYLYKRSNYEYDSDSSNSSFDSSLESLIRHNLSSAKALQPVSVSKAKERNFLHGRSGTDSMLGRKELERIFPKNEVSIFIATWNMNGEEPPNNLNELFLPSDEMENMADIYVIGTQESSETDEWEVCIQETIGPSHVLFHSKSFVPENDHCSVRPGSAFKTKGAIGICFYLFGSSFLFITAHLTAHDERLDDRINDIKKICRALELPKELPINKKFLKKNSHSVVNKFDYVFWFGDLNFRITQPREQVLQWIKTQSFPLGENLPFPFYDQLMSSMRKGLVFRNFQEANITFPPSYKFDIGTQVYDTSHKKRTPSYTDRILYKVKRSSKSILSSFGNYANVKCLTYTSVPSLSSSDHKPVWGLYTCKLRPGIDSVPLAAGQFNRDVYVDGMKRRAANCRNGCTLSDSKSCIIQ